MYNTIVRCCSVFQAVGQPLAARNLHWSTAGGVPFIVLLLLIIVMFVLVTRIHALSIYLIAMLTSARVICPVYHIGGAHASSPSHLYICIVNPANAFICLSVSECSMRSA